MRHNGTDKCGFKNTEEHKRVGGRDVKGRGGGLGRGSAEGRRREGKMGCTPLCVNWRLYNRS